MTTKMFLLVFFLTLIFVGPVLTIASLNTLFGLVIPVTVWTYLSVMWLGLVFAKIRIKA